MPRIERSRLGAGLAGMLLTTTALVSPGLVVQSQAAEVGTVTAVNQNATGTPPGAAAHKLAVGGNIVFKERIDTSADGSAQLGFLDRSTLNVGRGSSVVIDEFVYDPGADTGAMSVSISKGVLRFVGGQVSHTAGATIKTPVATIGIRGGVGTVGVGGAPGCPTGGLFINHFGVMKLKNNVDQTTITKPGYGVCVTSPDQPFPPPSLIGDEQLKKFMANLTSGPGQRGGVIEPPTDQMAARGGLGLPRIEPPPHPGGGPGGIKDVIGTGDGTQQGGAQNAQQPYYDGEGGGCEYSCSGD